MSMQVNNQPQKNHGVRMQCAYSEVDVLDFLFVHSWGILEQCRTVST